MGYVKQGFTDGQILTAKNLERIEDALYDLEGTKAPYGYVERIFSVVDETELNNALNSVFTTMANDTAKFVEISSTNGSFLKGHTYLCKVFRTSSGYGTAELTTYHSTGQIVYSRALYGGTWTPLVDSSPSAFAPAGYGLGEKLKYFADISTSEHFKKVCFFDSDDGPYTSSFAGINLTSDTWGFQLLFDAYVRSGTIITRRKYLNEWYEWEYINPPMELGVEYRTTERWQGKTVYRIAVEYGTLPNTTYKEVAPGVTATAVIGVSGYTTNTTEYNPIVMGHSGTLGAYPYLQIVSGAIIVGMRSTSDLSTYKAYFDIKYTKN